MELFDELFIIKTESKTYEKYIPFKEGGMLYWYNKNTFKAYLPYKLRSGLIKKLEKIGVFDIFVADMESEFMVPISKIFLLDKFIEIEKIKQENQTLF